MLKETDEFYKSPCDHNCKMKDYWFVENPEIGKQINLSTILICLGCIRFRSEDHFISAIDWGHDKD